MKLGQILIIKELITHEQLAFCLWKQEYFGGKLGRILISEGLITEFQLVECLAYQWDMPCVLLEEKPIPRILVNQYGLNVCLNYHFVPFCSDPESGALFIATSSYNEKQTRDAIVDIFPPKTKIFIAGANDVVRTLWANWIKPIPEFRELVVDLENETPVQNDDFESIEILEEINVPCLFNNLISETDSEDASEDIDIIEENPIESDEVVQESKEPGKKIEIPENFEDLDDPSLIKSIKKEKSNQKE
ncbi:hypothetical protein KKF34_17795 [Myxococcota bacterium]|nr:hypothetical protein [Myxococcota bacterium]MBU1382173.1 hypothetical protein [Myxococcota bacterium]MBU1498737.1 hypothetical protein [Myxococcota bacterium]